MSRPAPERRDRGRLLYEEIRARIADGTYAPGSALPSTRACAAERGLSRTTVSTVYEQLAAEGVIDSRPGAPSRIAAHAAAPRATRARPPAPANPRLSRVGQRIARLAIAEPVTDDPDVIDFVYGPLAGRDFPTLPWQRAMRQVEGDRPPRLAYDDPRGDADLRRALQVHLTRTRGLSCDVEQLVIVNGSQQGLDLCARLLLDPGDTVVVEDPGYRMAHRVFEATGARLHGVPVDEQGLRSDRLARVPSARMVYVTPTHQFPIGGFLPLGRRRELLDWSATTGAWVIEDDYDSEYRHTVRPEATLQSLDTQGRVIHVGTFSKTLSPQLRLGYLVLPHRLVGAFADAKRLTDRHAASAPQRALARLLADGSYDRHVRRIRRVQKARRDALVEALARHLGDAVVVQGAATGLHLVAWLPALPHDREAQLVAAGLRQRVRVHPIGPLHLPTRSAPARTAGLVMGYALLEPERIATGVQRLAAALVRLR